MSTRSVSDCATRRRGVDAVLRPDVPVDRRPPLLGQLRPQGHREPDRRGAVRGEGGDQPVGKAPVGGEPRAYVLVAGGVQPVREVLGEPRAGGGPPPLPPGLRGGDLLQDLGGGAEDDVRDMGRRSPHRRVGIVQERPHGLDGGTPPVVEGGLPHLRLRIREQQRPHLVRNRDEHAEPGPHLLVLVPGESGTHLVRQGIGLPPAAVNLRPRSHPAAYPRIRVRGEPGPLRTGGAPAHRQISADLAVGVGHGGVAHRLRDVVPIEHGTAHRPLGAGQDPQEHRFRGGRIPRQAIETFEVRSLHRASMKIGPVDRYTRPPVDGTARPTA